jgi:hypothetical protein
MHTHGSPTWSKKIKLKQKRQKYLLYALIAI